MTISPASASPQNGWILYDGACGFCLWWMRTWQGVLERHGFAVAPLQADWVAARVQMPAEQLTEDLRLLLPDQTIVSGADVYLHVMRRIWWAWPAAIFFGLPGLHCIFSTAYKIFNHNRFRFSKACGLPGHFHGGKPPEKPPAA